MKRRSTSDLGRGAFATLKENLGLILVVGLIASVGCGSEPPPPPPKPAAAAKVVAVQDTAVAAKAAVDKVAEEAATSVVFDYQPQVLRDPFEPYVEIEDVESDKEPLEFFDLEEIQILGIISGVRDARAKVRAGTEYFTIRKGTRLGKNHGQVIAIRTGEIVVRERFRDEVTRGYKYKNTIMRMER